MDSKLQLVLVEISKALNASGILWSVGASMLLYQSGLVDKTPSDLDIVVCPKDVNKVESILSQMGEKQMEEPSAVYSTDYFSEYIIRGVHIDVMAGFKINLENGVYGYKFDEKSVTRHAEIDGVDVPFSALEEWYILYQLIPNKKDKAALLKNYFIRNGIAYPYLLERMLNSHSLPLDIKKEAENLILGCSC